MITIYESNGRFYIWTAEDACSVRFKHRIIGVLVGCLPRLPLQNLHLGLPLILMNYEARLLVDQGFSYIVKESTLSSLRTESVEDINNKRKALYLEQVEVCKEDRILQMKQNASRIAEGKKKKLEGNIKGKRKLLHILNTLENSKSLEEKNINNMSKNIIVDHDDINNDKNIIINHDEINNDKVKFIENSSKDNIHKKIDNFNDSYHSKLLTDSQIVLEEKLNVLIEEEINEEYKRVVTSCLPEKSSCIQIHTARLENLSEENNLEFKKYKWDYSMSKAEYSKYLIFKYFWLKGYSLTSGSKFGGDFLIYPGDPSRFHSLYIAICVDPEDSLEIIKLVRLGRLGSSVKKTVLLCSVFSNNACYNNFNQFNVEEKLINNNNIPIDMNKTVDNIVANKYEINETVDNIDITNIDYNPVDKDNIVNKANGDYFNNNKVDIDGMNKFNKNLVDGNMIYYISLTWPKFKNYLL